MSVAETPSSYRWHSVGVGKGNLPIDMWHRYSRMDRKDHLSGHQSNDRRDLICISETAMVGLVSIRNF